MTEEQTSRFIAEVAPGLPCWRNSRTFLWFYDTEKKRGYDFVEMLAQRRKISLDEAEDEVRRRFPNMTRENLKQYSQSRIRRAMLAALLEDGKDSLASTSDARVLELQETLQPGETSGVGFVDLKRLRAITSATELSIRAMAKHLAVPCWDLPGRLAGARLVVASGSERELSEHSYLLPDAADDFVGNLHGAGRLIVLRSDSMTVLRLLSRAERLGAAPFRLVSWATSKRYQVSGLRLLTEIEEPPVLVHTGKWVAGYRSARALGGRICRIAPEHLQHDTLHARLPSERVGEWVDKAETWDQALEDELSTEKDASQNCLLLDGIFVGEAYARDQFLSVCPPLLKRKLQKGSTDVRYAIWRNVRMRMDAHGWHYKEETLCNLDWWVDTLIQFGSRTLYEIIVRQGDKRWSFTTDDRKMDRYPLATVREAILSLGGPLLVFEAGLQRSALRLAMESRPPRTLYLPGQAGWDENDSSFFFPRFRLSAKRTDVLPDEVTRLGSGYHGRDIRPPYPVTSEDVRYLDERPSSRLFWITMAQTVTHLVHPLTLIPFVPLRCGDRQTLRILSDVEEALNWRPARALGLHAIAGLCAAADGRSHWLKPAAEPAYYYPYDCLGNILVSYLEDYVKRKGAWRSKAKPRHRILSDIAAWWETVGGNRAKVLDAYRGVLWTFSPDSRQAALSQVLHLLDKQGEPVRSVNQAHALLVLRGIKLSGRSSVELQRIIEERR